jgi:hypothetical protein
MNHWRRTQAQRKAGWKFLLDLKPDIALLQETVPDDEIDASQVVFRPQGISKSRPWGSAVISFGRPISAITEARSRYSRKTTDLHQTLAGSLAIARVGNLTLISHYGVIENGYSVTTVHRQLSDLTPLFDSALGKRVILGGDLNISSQLEEPHGRRHKNVLERFASLGLVDCLGLQRPPRSKLVDCPCCDSDCQHVQTHRHDMSGIPWQDDYVFVTGQLVNCVSSCMALGAGNPDPWQFSDHCPLVMELNVDNE